MGSNRVCAGLFGGPCAVWRLVETTRGGYRCRHGQQRRLRRSKKAGRQTLRVTYRHDSTGSACTYNSTCDVFSFCPSRVLHFVLFRKLARRGFLPFFDANFLPPASFCVLRVRIRQFPFWVSTGRSLHTSGLTVLCSFVLIGAP